MQTENNSTETQQPNETKLSQFARLLPSPHRIARRSFLRSLGIGAALLAPAAGFIGAAPRAAADDDDDDDEIRRSDADILRFLAAAEIIETDLWKQYTELGGQDAPESSYRGALEILDEDQPQYISDNTDDEQSHVNFLNAYLHSKGAQGVNLNAFRTLPEQHCTRGEANRATDKSHPAHSGYQLVDPLPQHDQSRSRRNVPARGPEPGYGSPQRDSAK